MKQTFDESPFEEMHHKKKNLIDPSVLFDRFIGRRLAFTGPIRCLKN